MNAKLKEQLAIMLNESLDKVDKADDFNFEKAMNDLLDAYRKLKKGKDPNYQGYDLTESQMTVGCSKLKEQLTPDGIEYNKERGRDLLTVITMSAMQLGMNQGIKMGKQRGVQNTLVTISNLINKEDE